MKYAVSNFRIFPPLSRSELHSAVQPAVNAFGNHASTTHLPLRSLLREYVLPSVAGSVKSGAGSPTLSSAAGAWGAAGVASRPHATSASGSRHTAFLIDPPWRQTIAQALGAGDRGQGDRRRGDVGTGNWTSGAAR